MTKTKIEWADEVWNPVTGCTKVSEGCRNCYAERIAERFWGTREFTDLMFHTDRLNEPLHWKKPSRVFVNSMSDLFHPEIPEYFIKSIYKAMWQMAGIHQFIILTKRPDRAHEILTKDYFVHGNHIYGETIWLGVSVENQKTADIRIPMLIQTPAAVRFVSIEPMLDRISLQGYDSRLMRNYLNKEYIENHSVRGPLDWVICGCESGPKRRNMNMDWVRSLRDQCQAAKVPFFLKQMEMNGKIEKMPELDGKVWNEYPMVSEL